MNAPPVSLTAFTTALTALVIKRLKMIYFTQIIGTLFFAGAAIWLTRQPGSARPEQAGAEAVVRLLTLANAGVAVLLYIAGEFLFKLILRGRGVMSAEATAESA